MSFRQHFAEVAGDRECSHNVSAVNVYNCDINDAQKNLTAVKFGIYDFDNDKIINEVYKQEKNLNIKVEWFLKSYEYHLCQDTLELCNQEFARVMFDALSK